MKSVLKNHTLDLNQGCFGFKVQVLPFTKDFFLTQSLGTTLAVGVTQGFCVSYHIPNMIKARVTLRDTTVSVHQKLNKVDLKLNIIELLPLRVPADVWPRAPETSLPKGNVLISEKHD